MRHQKAGRKLSRTSSHRRALYRNMVTSLLLHEHIRTTEAKAKELRSHADQMITLGKRGDLHARRQAVAFIQSDEVVKKLFTELAARYKDRAGGYTRVIKLENRPGDNAPMAIIEMVDRPVKEEHKAEKKAKAAPAAKEGGAEKKHAPRKEHADTGEKKAAVRKPAKPAGEKKTATRKAPPSTKKV